MRAIIATLLLCIATSSTLMKIGIVAWYECNKTYISKNLCENRDKPQLKCCGKCYLRKQLSKAEEKPSNPGKPRSVRLSRIEIPLFVMPEADILRFRTATIIGKVFPPYEYPFAEGIMLPALHPPG